jgi:hypothetical protein
LSKRISKLTNSNWKYLSAIGIQGKSAIREVKNISDRFEMITINHWRVSRQSVDFGFWEISSVSRKIKIERDDVDDWNKLKAKWIDFVLNCSLGLKNISLQFLEKKRGRLSMQVLR